MAGGDGVAVLEAEVFGVGDSNDGVETEGFAEFGAEEGQGDGQWVSDAGGFHDDMIELVGAGEDADDAVDQVIVRGAADAAVVELDHVVGAGDDQVVVDADVAELVDEDGGADALAVGEDVVDQGGLATAEEASDQRYRQTVSGGAGWCAEGRSGGDHACGCGLALNV